MPFPSNSGTASLGLAQALPLAQAVAGNIKFQAQNLVTACGQGPVAANVILNYLTVLADAQLTFAKVAAVPGIAAYAQAQVGDANISAEFSAMTSAITAVTNWALANFPVDASGFLQAIAFTGDSTGRTQQATFTTAQTTGLVTVLNALIATIN
jgi:hypothetical protein